uniref:RNA methyltransferase n=1 Tax=Acanthochromis polyacanthus TaxID=80966 RepID=A0A3Q1G7E4_9TELE
MIRMSLDKETLLPLEAAVRVSPAFSSTVSLSEQPPLTKTHPFIRPKNGLQQPAGGQPPLPSQRIGKRRYSTGVGFKGPAKRRRRANSDSQSEPVLPSHFLLGGNIFDPLNLNSLLDEDVNRTTNQETPKCSPLPSRGGDPVEILVPRDITDPLNLKGGGEEGEGAGGVLLSPLKSRKRHRNRHHGVPADRDMVPARLFPPTAGLTGEAGTPGSTDLIVPASPLPCELNTAITCRDDVATPPILPRRHTHPPPCPAHKPGNQGDGRHRRRRRTTSVRSSDGTAGAVTMAATAQPTKFQTPCGPQPRSARPPERIKDKQRYQHGSHSRYYGYHGFYGDRLEGQVGEEKDPRIGLLEADWFRDKTVLDVGCGAGHMTLTIARMFNPAHILGVELDQRLVKAAKQNIRHFMSHDMVVEERKRAKVALPPDLQGGREQEVMREAFLSLPLSFRVSRGPLCAPPLLRLHGKPLLCIPSSPLWLLPQGDYVSELEPWPGRGRYDVIMCLSVTKWVQLQSGDGGVVRLFRRAYQSLSSGGLFILEP